MLATYGSYGVCWNCFGAVCWQPTGLMGRVRGKFLDVCWYLRVLWGVLELVWGCMLATYRSSGVLELVSGCMLVTYTSTGVCWSQFGAVCWQPTGTIRHVGASLETWFLCMYLSNAHGRTTNGASFGVTQGRYTLVI